MKRTLLTAFVTSVAALSLSAQEAPAYTVTPADGAQVESLSYMLVNWGSPDEVSSIEPVTDGSYGSFTFNGSNVSIDRYRFVASAANLRLDFATTLTEPGTLNWEIAAGTYRITLASGSSVLNDDMKGSVKVGKEEAPVVDGSMEFVASPEDYSSVNEISEFTITFTNSELGKVEAVKVKDSSKISALYGDEEGLVPSELIAEANKLTVKFDRTFAYTEGESVTFICIFFEGAVEFTFDNGNTAVNDTFAYTVVFEPEIEQDWTVINPEAGAYDEYPAVTIRCADVRRIQLLIGHEATLYIGEISVENPLKFPFEFISGDFYDEVVVRPIQKVDTFVEDAVYSLVIPSGSFLLTFGDQVVSNKEFIITDYSVKGITDAVDKIFNDSEQEKVFDLLGRPVANPGRGLYVTPSGVRLVK